MLSPVYSPFPSPLLFLPFPPLIPTYRTLSPPHAQPFHSPLLPFPLSSYHFPSPLPLPLPLPHQPLPLHLSLIKQKINPTISCNSGGTFSGHVTLSGRFRFGKSLILGSMSEAMDGHLSPREHYAKQLPGIVFFFAFSFAYSRVWKGSIGKGGGSLSVNSVQTYTYIQCMYTVCE